MSTLLSGVMLGQELEDDEYLSDFVPGLFAEYSSEGAAVQTLASNVTLDGPAYEIDRRLAGIGVQAKFRGLLQIKQDGRYQFRVYALGQVTVKVAGQQILQQTSKEKPGWFHCSPVTLEFGEHEIEIDYLNRQQRSSVEIGGNRLGLFWSGPGFGLEPVPTRALVHRREEHPQDAGQFEMGRQLSRGLRCDACHSAAGANAEHAETLPGPALTHLQGNLRPSWLVQHLSAKTPEDAKLSKRKMPFFELDRNSAMAISAALFEASQESPNEDSAKAALERQKSKRRKKDPPVRTKGDPQQGGLAFASLGCVACHQIDDLGQPQSLADELFGGGDLSHIATKRTREFLARWLADPSLTNATHRMPQFDLTPNQQLDLRVFLVQYGQENSRNDTRAAGDVGRGAGLIAKHRCGACHALPESLNFDTQRRIPLSLESDWENSCLTKASPTRARPAYGLPERQRRAIQSYYTHTKHEHKIASEQVLERGCTACHQRDQAPGIAVHLADVAEAFPETAAKLPALAPPPLNSVGDKLTDAALLAAIERTAPKVRSWLTIQMPRYRFAEGEAQLLKDYLISQDRLPEEYLEAHSDPIVATAVKGSGKSTELAAARLVTAQGFGCQSCHPIGPYSAGQVDLKARGPNLAMLAERVREPWFHRWVRNPSRIVPRMEMPAVQAPVAGVLDSDLDKQLEALWKTLNTPGFVPPRPNPVRTVRNHNQPTAPEPSQLVSCVIETPHKTYLRPLAIGLSNRQNILFDLESGDLAGYWLGDLASQYTRGKTWYWELGNAFLNRSESTRTPALLSFTWIDADGRRWEPAAAGQVAFRLDAMQHAGTAFTWSGALNVQNHDQSRWLSIEIKVWPQEGATVMEINLLGWPESGDRSGSLELLSAYRFAKQQSQAIAESEHFTVRVQRADHVDASTLEVVDGRIRLKATPPSLRWRMILEPIIAPDRVPLVKVSYPDIFPASLDCVPGYRCTVLPLPRNEMPISFAWGAMGETYVGSLKGRVLRLHDDDGDGWEDRYQTISDNLPTPFGLYANGDGSLDALAKYALLRLTPNALSTQSAHPWSTRVLADGWGYTADYHDWAIGLEKDLDGNYYMALPCQQDERSEAAAFLRGHALKLIPNRDSQAPREFRLESISAGLRFPIGIALSPEGELFTTDNQGNYNPFNELNHLKPGKRYGFINRLENKAGFSPPFEAPAINLPHPWTRSVNGICWLSTPEERRSEGRTKLFGPFEGHLLGCEMNGKSLIRMSLQRVGDTYQGAAYDFSLPGLSPDETFEGPIACEVGPTGDIYVGNLKDSGWNAGQNTGSIVRLTPTGSLPLGIAEVRARSTGFEVRFTSKVDPERAGDAEFYRIRSYRRISTPAYGGEDQDERTEKLETIHLHDGGRTALLSLPNLRAGFVYEITIGAIGPQRTDLFPAQAHYTMRAIPTPSQ